MSGQIEHQGRRHWMIQKSSITSMPVKGGKISCDHYGESILELQELGDHDHVGPHFSSH
jgi:hypothetical protein